jgi:PAS domain S-box-containing protein
MNGSDGVLLVDDSNGAVTRLVEALQQDGYAFSFKRVDTVEALRAALGCQQWDLIVMNRSMAETGGSVAAGLLEEDGLSTPAIIVPGEAGESFVSEVLKAYARHPAMEGIRSKPVGAIALDVTRREPVADEARHMNRELERRVAEHTKQRDEIVRTLEKEVARRKQAEEALKAKAEELNHYFNGSPDLLTIADVGGYLHYVNPEWEKVLGYSLRELVGHRFLDLIHPEDLPATLGAVATLADQKEVVDFVNRYRCKDDSWRWIEWRAYPAGRSMYAIGRDITARREAEDAFRKQTAFDELLTRILTRFAAGIPSEVDGAVTGALQAIAEFVGADHAYIIAIASDRRTYRLTHEWCAPHVPPQREHYQDIPFGTLPWSESRILAGEIIQTNRPGDLPPEAEAERRMPDVLAGQSSLLNVPIYVTAGVLHGLIGLDTHSREVAWTTNDVTRLKMVGDAIANAIDRKHADEELRRANAYNRGLLEVSLDPLVTIGPDGRITDVNTATEQMTGLPRQALIGTDFSDYFTDPQRARKGYQLAFREGLVKDYALELRHRNGDVHSVHYNASVYWDETGNVVGVFAAARDVTERLRAELETHKLRDELAHVARVATLGELTASIAHEVRQPLTAIMSNAQAALHLLAREMPDVEEVRAALRDIVDDDRRAEEVIRRLRTMMQRHRTGHEYLDLNDVTRQVLAMVRNEAVLRNLEIRELLSPGIAPVKGDRIQLQQVILNLLLNGAEAISQTLDGSRVLMIRTALLDPRNVAVSVSDSGIGVNVEDTEKLFTPFYTTKPDGLGMGLPVSRSIVQAHRGRLWAEPNRGGGTTFHMAIPAASVRKRRS